MGRLSVMDSSIVCQRLSVTGDLALPCLSHQCAASQHPSSQSDAFAISLMSLCCLGSTRNKTHLRESQVVTMSWSACSMMFELISLRTPPSACSSSVMVDPPLRSSQRQILLLHSVCILYCGVVTLQLMMIDLSNLNHSGKLFAHSDRR